LLLKSNLPPKKSRHSLKTHQKRVFGPSFLALLENVFMYFLVAEISAMAAFHDFQPPDLRPDHPQRWRSFAKVGVKWMQIAMAPSTWMNFRCSSASERWTGGVPASWVGGRNGEGCEVWVRPKGC